MNELMNELVPASSAELKSEWSYIYISLLCIRAVQSDFTLPFISSIFP